MRTQRKLSVTMALLLILNTIFSAFLGIGNIAYAKDSDISSKVVTQLIVNPKEILEGEKISVNISFEGNKGSEKDIQVGDEINIKWQKNEDSILFATPEIIDVFQDEIKIAEFDIHKDGGKIKFNEKVDNMENIQSSVKFDLSTEKITDQNDTVTEEVSSGDKTALITINKNSDKEDVLLNNAEIKLEPAELKSAALNRDNIFAAQDGGNIDNDVTRNGLLGIAKYFHIFANNATLSADTAGNVAVGNLKANSNFGTRIKEGLLPLDISYIQNASFIQSSSFVNSNGNRSNKAVFGEKVELTLVDNGNKVAANGSKLDHLNKDEIFQDKNGNKYIDFEKEFTQLKNSSDQIATHKQTTGVEKNFNDENNRYFDVSKVKTNSSGMVSLTKTDEKGTLLDGVVFDLYKVGNNTSVKKGLKTQNGKITVTDLEKGDYYFKETETISGYTLNTDEHKFSIKDENLGLGGTIYLDLTKEELEKDRPIIIKGIDKNGPNIIVNVDTKNAQTINVGAEIKLKYIDGTDRQNHETEDFSDAVVLWNFKNRAGGQTININRARFQGSVLAIGDTINVGQNVDGCIIANNVNINGGESHRWDFQEKFWYEGKPVELSVINKKIPESEEPVKPDEEYVKINVEKKWEGKIPENKEVVIELYADDKKIEGKSVTLNKDNSWKSSFENLPKYKDNKEIKYEIKEVKVDGYSTKIEKSEDSTNTEYWVKIKSPQDLEANSKYLMVIQDWQQPDTYYLIKDDGQERKLGLKPFSVRDFVSIRNGKLKSPLNFGDKKYDEYLDLSQTGYNPNNDGMVWIYGEKDSAKTLRNLNSGNYITLKVKDFHPNVDIKPYFSFITSKKDGFYTEYYNSKVNYSRNLDFKPGAGPTMTQISCQQKWGEHYVKRLYMYLSLYNGKEIEGTCIGDWAGNFEFLKKISETTYDFTVTNKETPPWTPMEPPTRDIKVTKLWKDHNGKPITAPTDKIIVELYKDGNPTGKKEELNASNNWTVSFKNLEVANGLGSTDYYKYTVKEIGEDGNAVKFDGKQYKVVYGGSMKDGLTITNEKEAPPTPPTPNNPTPNKPEVPNTSTNKTLPKTGDGSNISLYAWLMLTSGALLVLIGYKRRKHAK